MIFDQLRPRYFEGSRHDFDMPDLPPSTEDILTDKDRDLVERLKALPATQERYDRYSAVTTTIIAILSLGLAGLSLQMPSWIWAAWCWLGIVALVGFRFLIGSWLRNRGEFLSLDTLYTYQYKLFELESQMRHAAAVLQTVDPAGREQLTAETIESFELAFLRFDALRDELIEFRIAVQEQYKRRAEQFGTQTLIRIAAAVFIGAQGFDLLLSFLQYTRSDADYPNKTVLETIDVSILNQLSNIGLVLGSTFTLAAAWLIGYALFGQTAGRSVRRLLALADEIVEETTDQREHLRSVLSLVIDLAFQLSALKRRAR